MTAQSPPAMAACIPHETVVFTASLHHLELARSCDIEEIPGATLVNDGIPRLVTLLLHRIYHLQDKTNKIFREAFRCSRSEGTAAREPHPPQYPNHFHIISNSSSPHFTPGTVARPAVDQTTCDRYIVAATAGNFCESVELATCWCCSTLSMLIFHWLYRKSPVMCDTFVAVPWRRLGKRQNVLFFYLRWLLDCRPFHQIREE